MKPIGSSHADHPLARHRGLATLTASEAIVKAVLECRPSVGVLSVTESDSTRTLIELIQSPGIRDVLRMNRLQVLVSPDATRAYERAAWAARSGQHVQALLTGPTAASAVASIRSCRILEDVPQGAIGCIMEDRRSLNGVDLPGTLLLRSGIPLIAASGVEHLRDCVEHGLRLSRAEHTPSVTLVHPATLHSGATILLRPNRSDDDPEDVGLRQGGRGPRWTEAGGALRMGRRLELNTHSALPSPGDPATVGFITVGPMHASLLHVLTTVGMLGRVPVLHLGMIQPIDEEAVKRMLTRCRTVVVLEPSAGAVEDRVLACAERLRGPEIVLATVWGRRLPMEGDIPNPAEGSIHPSVLARRIMPLLMEINPEASRSARLDAEPPAIPMALDNEAPPIGHAALDHQVDLLATSLHDSVNDDGIWLGTPTVIDGSEPSEALDPVRVSLRGVQHGPPGARPVMLENWSHDRFVRFGGPAVVQASSDTTQHLMLVSQYQGAGHLNIERLARSMVPPERADRIVIRRSNIADRDRTLHVIREIMQAGQHGLVVLVDGPPAQYSIDAKNAEFREIDQRGYQVMQRVIWPSERACVIRQSAVLSESEAAEARAVMPAETTWSIDPIAMRWPPRLGGRIRPLVEQVEVFRTRAPKRRGESSRSGLPNPTPRHADRPRWFAHLAGLRGSAPGAAATFLITAGEHMGYRVRYRCNPEPIGAGRSAWAQIVFTSLDDDRWDDGLSCSIPFGEADLLLGFDRIQTLRAVGPDEMLRVGSSSRTTGVVNTGLFEDQLDLGQANQDMRAIEAYLAFRLCEGGRYFASFSELCRYRFHNERMADVVQLGVAFQLGWIPATVESMIQAAKGLEELGYARSSEAFDFGRRLALDEKLDRLPVEDHADEPTSRIVRRYGHALRRTGPGRLARASRFRQLVQRTLNAMPDLEASRSGRAAKRDLVIALRRCMIWRSFEDAERLAYDVTALYQSARDDRGRRLAQLAILPLAESTLIRDAIYMASMAISPEHRRRTRQRLNVKRGRGDRIESRYVTRIELVLIRWRFRVDLRTSDWLTKLLAWMRRVIPRGWRGTRRDREVRTLVRGIVHRATRESDRHDHWFDVLSTLHSMAGQGELRSASPDDVKALSNFGSSAIDQQEGPA